MGLRKLSAEEVSQIQPLGSLDETSSGVRWNERFVVENLTKNPQAAEAYLRKLGYQVRRYGPGWEIAVRRQAGEIWKPVDPKGLDAQDIFDFIGDLAVGTLQTAGAFVGGLVGSLASPVAPVASTVAGGVAGGAAGGAIGEAGRQALGSLAGVPDNIGGAEIAGQAAMGGAMPALGAVARPVGGMIKNVAVATSARIAGVRETANMSATQALKVVAQNKLGSLASRGKAGSLLRTLVADSDQTAIKQAQQADDLLKQIPGAADLSTVRDRLLSFTRNTSRGPVRMRGAAQYSRPGEVLAGAGTKEAERAAKEKALSQNVSDTLEEIRHYVGNEAWHSMPVAKAAGIKRILQRRSRFDVELPTGQEFQGLMKEAAFTTRGATEQAVTAAGRPEYVQMMRETDRSISLVTHFQRAIKDDGAAVRYVKGVYGDNFEAERAAIQDFERHFGVSLMDTITKSQAAAQVGSKGLGGIAPRSLLGAGFPLTAGAGAAVYSGHPLIAAGVLAGGSPRVQVGLARGAFLASRGLDAARQAGAGVASKVSALAAIKEQVGLMRQREGVREDAPKKKPRVVVGGGY